MKCVIVVYDGRRMLSSYICAYVWNIPPCTMLLKFNSRKRKRANTRGQWRNNKYKITVIEQQKEQAVVRHPHICCSFGYSAFGSNLMEKGNVYQPSIHRLFRQNVSHTRTHHRPSRIPFDILLSPHRYHLSEATETVHTHNNTRNHQSEWPIYFLHRHIRQITQKNR